MAPNIEYCSRRIFLYLLQDTFCKIPFDVGPSDTAANCLFRHLESRVLAN